MIWTTALGFLLAGTAQAEPANVVVLSTDTGADMEKVHHELKVRIARPAVEWIDDTLPAGTSDALQRNPNECTPTLPEDVRDSLKALGGEDELYVVLPTTDHHKDIAIWRWDDVSGTLQKVMDRRNSTLGYEVSDAPARVLHVHWPNGKTKSLPSKSLTSLNRSKPQVEIAGDGFDAAFIDTIMEHPNECTPEMTKEMVSTLEAEATKTPDADIYVAIMANKRMGPYLWRWDEELGALSRVLL